MIRGSRPGEGAGKKASELSNTQSSAVSTQKAGAAARRSAVRDMTEGSPLKLILGFAIPMLLGTLFQQLYSMADTIIVGRFLGVDALAAVGSTGAVNFLVNGFVIGVCSGFAIPVSQQFGAGDHVNMRRYTANIVWLGLVIAAVLTAFVSMFTRQILTAMQTPGELMDRAYLYILIVFLGIPATFLYNATASVIRALGDARTPVYFLILASVVNIVLDCVLVGLFGFDVNGPALATVFSQALSGFLCLVYMYKNIPILRFRKGETALSAHHCMILCAMGIPMGLQYSVTAIGSVVLQTAVNTLGAAAVAAMAAGQKIHMFFACVFDALGVTMATWSGQNLGAGKVDRITEGVWTATKLGCVYGVAAFGIMLAFGGVIPLLFIDASNTEVIQMTHTYLIWTSLFYWSLTIVNVWRFAIQGMGWSGFSILSGVMEMIARTVAGFAGVPLFGFTAVCFASPLAWVLANLFLVPAFYHCTAKAKKLLKIRKEESVKEHRTAHSFA